MRRNRMIALWAAVVAVLYIAHAAIGIRTHDVLTHQSPRFGTMSPWVDQHSPRWPHLATWQLVLARAAGLIGVCALAAVGTLPVWPRGRADKVAAAVLVILGVIVGLAGPLGLWWMFANYDDQVAPGRATTLRETVNLVVVGLDLLIVVGALTFARRVRR